MNPVAGFLLIFTVAFDRLLGKLSLELMISPQGLEIGAQGFIRYSYALKKLCLRKKIC